MKIRPVEAELFHAEGETAWRTGGQTDMTKLIVAFRSFSNASKNSEESFAVHWCGTALTSLMFHCDVVTHIKTSSFVQKFGRKVLKPTGYTFLTAWHRTSVGHKGTIWIVYFVNHVTVIRWCPSSVLKSNTKTFHYQIVARCFWYNASPWFGHTFWPSSRSYECGRCVQCIWQPVTYNII